MRHLRGFQYATCTALYFRLKTVFFIRCFAFVRGRTNILFQNEFPYRLFVWDKGKYIFKYTQKSVCYFYNPAIFANSCNPVFVQLLRQFSIQIVAIPVIGSAENMSTYGANVPTFSVNVPGKRTKRKYGWSKRTPKKQIRKYGWRKRTSL